MNKAKRMRMLMVQIAEIVSDDWWLANHENGSVTQNAQKAVAKIKRRIKTHEEVISE
tara:strand:- start:10635 stop:10805 length:171 start_codon:yes stop_codon:yes gene_type:complete